MEGMKELLIEKNISIFIALLHNKLDSNIELALQLISKLIENGN